ncbi:DUF4160 domain-containing protein [Tianweitania sp. BSSL-BM11]|uniref:DUF4160 domain-containing protein n=1 Tax=Tianweitania aestuarii TaxID=2814886 RepID=A0ABS5RQV2_9HYPH|nr:DUF4160 domain-containing protein [Tianweitania aestuarii]MBS9719359.1 DUF4160 domain-containing protein [Tianweitania aestuarii]
MPVVFRHKGFRFLFYSNEGDPREPMHVHALKDGLDAKFWLWPEVSVAYNDGYSARTLRELIELITHRRQLIASEWNAFFGESN